MKNYDRAIIGINQLGITLYSANVQVRKCQ